MKVRIVSDGTFHGTRVENAETGELLECVTAASWTCDRPGGFATVTLTVAGAAIEVVGEAAPWGDDDEIPCCCGCGEDEHCGFDPDCRCFAEDVDSTEANRAAE